MAKRSKVAKSAPVIDAEIPPEDAAGADETSGGELSCLPKPRTFQMPPGEFFAYWSAIPKELRDERVVVYPYRLLPEVDVLQPLDRDELELIRQKKKQPPQKNLGKLADPLDPEHWALDLAKRWGAGDYYLRLNDSHPSTKARTICITATNGEYPLREWSNYPPLVNLAEVVLPVSAHEPHKNQAYIRWAHLNGIHFPGEPEYQAQEEVSDVANVEAVSKMTDAVIEMSRERARENRASPDLASSAGTKTLEVMASAAAEGQKIITNAITTAQNVAAQVGDPLTQAGKVIEMVRAMMPAPVPPPPAPVAGSSTSGFMEAFTLFKELMTIQNANTDRMHQDMAARLKSTEDALREMTSKAMTAVNPGPSKAGFGVLDDILSIKEKLDRLTGGNGQDNGLPAWAPFAMRAGEMLINGAQNIVHNVAAMRGVQNLAPPVPVSADEGEVAELPEGSAIPERAPELNTEDVMYKMYARQMHRPLLEALTAGEPGYKLAGRVVVQAGEPVYRFLVGLGPQGVVGLLQKAPEVWSDVVRFGSRAEVFISEFLQADQALLEAETIRNLTRASAAEMPRRSGRTVLGPDGRPIRVSEPVVQMPPQAPSGQAS